MKRIISVILSVILAFSTLMSFELVSAAEKYETPLIEPIGDTYIMKSAPESNFSQETDMILNSALATDGIGLMKFDISEYKEQIKYADKITLTMTMNSNAGEEGGSNKIGVYPLSGKYKNIDIETVTYNIAKAVTENDVSLVDFRGDEQKYEDEIYKFKTLHIDITQYCKDINDDFAVFMLKSLSGKYNVFSADAVHVGYIPYIEIESDYTTEQNRIYNITQEIYKYYNDACFSESVELPSIKDCTVTMESKTPEIADNNGIIYERPQSTENDIIVDYAISVTSNIYNTITETANISVRILRDGAYSAEVHENDNLPIYEFNNIALPDSSEKLLMKISGVELTDGEQYAISDDDGNFESTFIYDFTKPDMLFDVTQAWKENISFKIADSEGNNVRIKSPVIYCLSQENAEGILRVYNHFETLKDVKENLTLPSQSNNFSVVWDSENRNIITNSGEIIRGENDQKVNLYAELSNADCKFSITFCAYVVRKYTDVPDNEYPELKDPMYMSDETLFGKYNTTDSMWDIEPILRYDLFEGLNEVEEAAKEGDYITAKELLLTYYRSKSSEEMLIYQPRTTYTLSATALIDHIFSVESSDALVGEGSVGSAWDWYDIDLSGYSKNLYGTYWILDADMDGTALEIYSKENPGDKKAYLEVTVKGKTTKYEVVADTYISAGENNNTNYGSETMLYSREAAGDKKTPFGSDTRRPYFRFDLPTSLVAADSVKLVFYGRNNGAGSKNVYALTSNDLRELDENMATWNHHSPRAFNFTQTGFLWLDQPELNENWNSDFEWINASGRLDQAETLLRVYLSNKNKKYLYRALELTMSMYEQQPSFGYPRPLDSAWRTENLIKILYTTINEELMTPELFTAIFKYMYGHTGLRDITLSSTNQDSAVKVNFARICAYFPEIAEDGWWELAKTNLGQFYSGKLLNEDGSYTESTSNYISGVIDEIQAAAEMVRARDGKEDEFYLSLLETCKKLMEYHMTLAYSDGNVGPWGDGSRYNLKSSLEERNKMINDPYIEFFATSGERGTEPKTASRLYPAKAICMMRSGWHDSDLCAFINSDSGGGHGHYDDLSLDVYAYGQYLLVDGGKSDYSTTTEFGANRHRTLYHNTIQIDDKNQNYQTKNEPGYMALKSNKFFDFVHAGATKAYDGFDMNRKVLLLKNKYIIVSDYIFAPKGTHTYKQLWHPDYNHSLQLDNSTGTAYTTYNTGANIKIVQADMENTQAKLFDSLMYRTDVGEAESRAVSYVCENASGNQTFNTVLYPQAEGMNTEISASMINLGVDKTVATAMKIEMDDNTGYFYSSNEETPSLRSFENYSYGGEMAYVEEDIDGKITCMGITDGKTLTKNGNAVFETVAGETLSDFSVKYESTKIKMYSSEELPASGVKVLSDKAEKKVYFNDKEVEVTEENGYILTSGVAKSEETGGSGSLDGSKPVSGGGGSGGGGTGAEKEPEKESEEEENTDPNTEKISFNDIVGHWADKEILYLAEEGILNGFEDNNFYPERSITRAEFVKIIALALDVKSGNGNVTFDDVSSDMWYYPYISALYNAGLIGGYPDNTFCPNGNITREEIAKILCNSIDYSGIMLTVSSDINFSDNDNISMWAEEYVKKAYAAELLKGDDKNNFRPKDKATRAEAATVIYRVFDFIKKKGESHD